MRSDDYPGHGQFLPYLINKAATLLNVQLQKILEPQGLTLTHWRVLAFLGSETQPDGLTIGALAEATMTEQSTLSRALKPLEERGLIRRQASKADNRAVHIYLAAKGRQTFDRWAERTRLYLKSRTADHWLMFIAGLLLGALLA